jgi:hypothetical protein
MKIAGFGSIGHRYGFGDQDPDQNVTDPQHWFRGKQTHNEISFPEISISVMKRFAKRKKIFFANS